MTIRNQVNMAYVAGLPPQCQGVFQWNVLPQGERQLVSNRTLSQWLDLMNLLESFGYTKYMLGEVAWFMWEPYLVLVTYSNQGVTQIPNATQPQLGQAGQFALPNAFEPGVNIAAYPTTPQPGWITVPPMSQLNDPNANVSELIAQWFPPWAQSLPTRAAA